MGNLLVKPNETVCVDQTRLQYRKVTHNTILESLDIWKDAFDLCIHLTQPQFEEVFSHWLGECTPHFEIWKCSKGRVDGFEMFCGLFAYADGTLDDKIQQLFHLFDLDRSNSLSSDQLIMLFYSCVKAFSRLAGQPTKMSTTLIQQIVSEARKSFRQIDRQKNMQITVGQFHQWVLSNKPVINFLQLTTEGTDIYSIISRKKSIVDPTITRFKILMDDLGSLPTTQAIDFLKESVNDLMDSEISQLIDIADSNGSVSVKVFETLIDAIVSFDLIDKNNQKSLNAEELKALLWLLHGVEPSNRLVSIEMKQLGLDVNSRVSRLRWVEYMSIPGGVA